MSILTQFPITLITLSIFFIWHNGYFRLDTLRGVTIVGSVPRKIFKLRVIIFKHKKLISVVIVKTETYAVLLCSVYDLGKMYSMNFS